MAPVLPQLSSITSEALQAQIRLLLPSQDGFGADLAASNVIQPIIDLTSAAEGTTVRADLQSALAFGSQTAFSVANTTTTLANTVGFWRIFGVASGNPQTSAKTMKFSMTDGLSSKDVWKFVLNPGATNSNSAIQFDFVVFLSSGESISATTDGNAQTLAGSYRQIADVNGNPTNPSGFTPQ